LADSSDAVLSHLGCLRRHICWRIRWYICWHICW